jgi:peptidoglycan/xylan/chitin deacetylase (PgdA/CDA1 family)
MKRLLSALLIAALIPATTSFSAPDPSASPQMVSKALSKKSGPAATRLPVLCYHEIAPTATTPLTTPVKDFALHMEHLRKEGYTPITLEEARLFYWGSKRLPGKPILITFDDGYEGVYKYAVPILERYKFKSVLFLVVGRVGQAKPIPHLTWDELKKMKDSGLWEFGSHTFNLHVYLRERLQLGGVYPNQLVADLRKSRVVLKKKLGVDATSFAWPYGRYDEATIQLAAKAGFNMQFTIDFGATKAYEGANRVKRYIMMEDDSPIQTFKSRLAMCEKG